MDENNLISLNIALLLLIRHSKESLESDCSNLIRIESIGCVDKEKTQKFFLSIFAFWIKIFSKNFWIKKVNSLIIMTEF